MKLQKTQHISRSLVIVSSKKCVVCKPEFPWDDVWLWCWHYHFPCIKTKKPLGAGNFDPPLCSLNFLIAPNKLSLKVYKIFSAVVSFLISQLLVQHPAAFTKRCPLCIAFCISLEWTTGSGEINWVSVIVDVCEELKC